MTCDEMRKRHKMKIFKNVTWEVDVGTKIMNPNLLHDLLHGVMCKQRKCCITMKCQFNIASKPAPGMQGCTMTKNKHLTSL